MTTTTTQQEHYMLQAHLEELSHLPFEGRILFAFKRAAASNSIVIAPALLSEFNAQHTLDISGNVVVGANVISQDTYDFVSQQLIAIAAAEGTHSFAIADYTTMQDLYFSVNDVRPDILCLVNNYADEIASTDWSTIIDDSSKYKLDDICYGVNCIAIIPLSSNYLFSVASLVEAPINSSRIVLAYGKPVYGDMGTIDLAPILAMALARSRHNRSLNNVPIVATDETVSFEKHSLTKGQSAYLGALRINTLKWSRQQGRNKTKALTFYPGYTTSNHDLLGKIHHSYLVQSIIRNFRLAIGNPSTFGLKNSKPVIGEPININLLYKIAYAVLDTYNLNEVNVKVVNQYLDIVDIDFTVRPYGELTGVTFSVRIGDS